MAEVQTSRGPLFIRPARAVKLGRGSQNEEFLGSPRTIQIITNQYGDGSASGDAIASGDLNALANFAGSASGDATATAEGSQIFSGISVSRNFERGFKCFLRRGPILEIGSPLVLNAPTSSFGDGAGAASGDAIASGDLNALADFAGSASGDAIASGSLDALADQAGSASGDATASAEDGSIFFPFSVWEERLERRGPNRSVKLGRGAQVEFKQPITLTVIQDAVTAGAASGDAAASGELSALADFAGTAIGDAVASASGASLSDALGAASGDAIASGSLDALADTSGTAIGDAIASAEYSANEDRDGIAIGDSTASGELDALADFAGTATGDAIVNGFIEDATPPVVVTPPAEGGAATGVGHRAWASWYKSTQPRKKKKPEPVVVEAAIAAKEEADDRLASLMAEKRVLLAHISELEFARYRAAAQADVKRAAAELALARELEDEDEAMVWLMAA